MHLFADEILIHDGIKFDEIEETSEDGKEMHALLEVESSEKIWVFGRIYGLKTDNLLDSLPA